MLIYFFSLSLLSMKYHQELPNRDFDCLWCESYTHKTIDCVEMKRSKECGNNHDADASYPASDKFQNRSPLDWFADSGASRHMTHNKALPRNFQPITQGTWTVTGIKNTTLEVHGIGEVHLTTQVIKTQKKKSTFFPVDVTTYALLNLD